MFFVAYVSSLFVILSQADPFLFPRQGSPPAFVASWHSFSLTLSLIGFRVPGIRVPDVLETPLPVEDYDRAINVPRENEHSWECCEVALSCFNCHSDCRLREIRTGDD